MAGTGNGAGGRVGDGVGAGAGALSPPELGRWGEDVAADHLAAAGLVLLARNWRCREGELDLVAIEDGRRLVVCEVKTRSGLGFGAPAEAVSPAKAARIRRLTAAFLRAHRMGWVEVRFDVVAVVAPAGAPMTVEHLRGAF